MTDEKAVRIQAAIDALVEAGQRPSIRSVRKQMLRTHGSSYSFREIVPAVSAWRAEVHRSRRVRDAARVYLALNAEERAGFESMIRELEARNGH